MSENTNTPAENTAVEAPVEEKKQEEKTFTQQQVDSMVQDRIARLKKDMPSEDDLTAYKAWKETQQSESEKTTASISKANKERDEATAEVGTLKKQIAVLGKGVPADKVQQYSSLADSYIKDGVDFNAALDLALKAFPIEATKPTVPGSGGNPPATEQKNKSDRPSGVVTW